MILPKIELKQKPTYLKFAEGLDFFELFQKIEGEFDNCFILESLGEQGSLSRYSIIGFDPKHIIRAKGKRLYFGEQEFEVENPYFALREMVPQNAISRNYAGGLIGYLSYEALNYFEPSLSVKVHDLFDQFKFGVFLDGVVLDKVTNELFYFYYDVNRLGKLQEIVKASIKSSEVKVKALGNTLTQEEHKKAVLDVKEEILKGNTFQCEVGFKTEFEISGNPIAIYKNLREINPSPFMYYLKFGSQIIVGASPELLFRLKDGEMETYPLAGTINRGKDETEDKKLAQKLLSDPKEIAEHNMLVDLHRNDIGRVAQFGTVKVRNFMDIKKFSHVQHISSEIIGLIAPKEDMFSSLAANFPAGTLTGAPKIESIRIIDRLEKEARGPYGGAVGHFGFNGDCTFAIDIRSLFISGDYAYTQTCGGIVYDSEPDKEYQEIVNKLAAMKEALKI
jgi:anthranilate synthase component I